MLKKWIERADSFLTEEDGSGIRMRLPGSLQRLDAFLKGGSDSSANHQPEIQSSGTSVSLIGDLLIITTDGTEETFNLVSDAGSAVKQLNGVASKMRISTDALIDILETQGFVEL